MPPKGEKMSAFIVTNKTLNRVLGLRSWVDGDIGWEADEWGRELLQMNRDAVNVRYHQQKDPPPYTFARNMIPATLADKCQAVKSARCLRYQCAEGNIPECNLFKQLDTLIDRAACMIVNGLPETGTAKWDKED